AQALEGVGDFLALHKGHAVLRHHNAARVQAGFFVFIKIGGKQHFGRANGVGGIGNDHIERVLALRHKCFAIGNHAGGARVVIGTSIVLGEILFAHVNHAAVDLDLSDVLNVFVLQYFAQNAAVTAADNEYALRVRVGEQRHMHHHFVVNKFVALGGLHHAIEQHHAAHKGGFNNLQMLVFGFDFKQHFFNGKGLGITRVQRFADGSSNGHNKACGQKKRWRDYSGDAGQRPGKGTLAGGSVFAYHFHGVHILETARQFITAATPFAQVVFQIGKLHIQVAFAAVHQQSVVFAEGDGGDHQLFTFAGGFGGNSDHLVAFAARHLRQIGGREHQ